MENATKIHKCSSSERFQLLCRKRGYTLKQFIEIFQNQEDVSEETIRSWYYRDILPRKHSHLQTLCRLLDCNADFLLGLIDDTTHDRAFIRKETGLSETAIERLQKSNYSSSGGFSELNITFKTLGAAVNCLLTTEHGLNILQLIYDYINSRAITLSLHGESINEDIIVENAKTHNSYSLSPKDYDALILTQIQQELTLLKDSEYN